jgi:uncharacterized protein (TIGR03435 family)
MPILGVTAARSLRSFRQRGHYGLCEKCGLAFDLSRKLGRPVLNKTKLEGLYDFQIEYSRRDEDDAPSIFTALRDRLGLTLNPAKGPVDILVIDSIEKPSAN